MQARALSLVGALVAVAALFVCAGGANAQVLQPGINIDSRTPGFEAQVNRCLTELTWLGDISSRVVNDLRGAPYFVVITPATNVNGFRNDTRPIYRNGNLIGANIFWNPNNTRPYADGAPRIPCATLLHEMQHADDIVNGGLGRPIADPRDARGRVGPAEFRASQTENWYLWRYGKKQRRTYESTPLPGWAIWGTVRPGAPAPEAPAPTLQPPGPTPGPSLPAPAPAQPPPVQPPLQPTPVQPLPVQPPPLEPPRDTSGELTLTVVNDTPNLILIAGRTSTEELLCGGNNPYFRAHTTQRHCTLQIRTAPDRNPIAVPVTTLVAYFPSGDPAFPRGGRVVWSDDKGNAVNCGGNAYSEYCQIQMGTPGSYGPGQPTRGKPSSRTVHVRYEAGRSSSGVAP